MFRSIFHEGAMPAEQPAMTGTALNVAPAAIKRNVRNELTVKPGEAIYDRARVIFSRARRGGRSRAASII